MKKKDYDVQFMREHYKRIHILLNHEKDKDIIEYLSKQGSVNRFIKDMIRKQMKESK